MDNMGQIVNKAKKSSRLSPHKLGDKMPKAIQKILGKGQKFENA